MRLPPEFPILFTVLITSLTVATPARALTKAAAERNGRVLIIDKGGRAGEVDDGDWAVDLGVPSGRGGSQGEIRIKAELAAREADRITPIARDLLAHFDLPWPRANVVDAFRGSPANPLILIYPERHLERDDSAGNRRVQTRGTRELIQLTERLLRRGLKPMNLIEYPFGPVELLSPVPTKARDRARAVDGLVRIDRYGMGLALAELFRDLIQTVPIDDPLLYAMDEAGGFAFELRQDPTYAPGRSYLGALDAHMEVRGAKSQIGNPAVYAHFLEMLTGDQTRGYRRNGEISEARSLVMADQIAAATYGHAIGFAQIGANHVYGVARRLRELNFNYLVLSP